MDSSQPSQPPQIFKPLMLTAVGVMFTAFITAIYHWARSRYSHESTTGDDQRGRPDVRRPVPTTTSGVEEKVLECIPILHYSSKQVQVSQVDQSDCAVCLGEFEEGVVVRLLPSCGHAFHMQCIDAWFLCHSSCPICRSPVTSLVPLRVATVPVTGAEDEPSTGGDDNRALQIASHNSTRSLVSFKLQNDKNPSLSPVVLSRSMSMDGSYVAIRVHGRQQGDSSLTSSSSSSSFAGSSSTTSSSSPPSSMAAILVDDSYRLRSFQRTLSAS